jgi:hypothetical protein
MMAGVTMAGATAAEVAAGTVVVAAAETAAQDDSSENTRWPTLGSQRVGVFRFGVKTVQLLRRR